MSKLVNFFDISKLGKKALESQLLQAIEDDVFAR